MPGETHSLVEANGVEADKLRADEGEGETAVDKRGEHPQRA
jgi:hypothetical protein